jgi:two-component system chemotaxis sensor kinase CheA
MVGLEEVEQLTHSIESMLRSLRQAELTFTVERLDGLDFGSRSHRKRSCRTQAKQPLPSIGAAIHQLRQLSASDTSSSSVTAPLQVTSGHGEEPRTTALRRWTLSFTPTGRSSERGININTVRDRLKEIGEILKSTPQVKAQGEISFQFVVETEVDLATETWNEDGLVVTAGEEVVREAVKPTLPVNPFESCPR